VTPTPTSDAVVENFTWPILLNGAGSNSSRINLEMSKHFNDTKNLTMEYSAGKGITITAIFQNSAKRKFHHLYIKMVQIGDSPSLYHIIVIYFSHDI
jgi:hypothetical protein